MYWIYSRNKKLRQKSVTYDSVILWVNISFSSIVFLFLMNTMAGLVMVIQPTQVNVSSFKTFFFISYKLVSIALTSMTCGSSAFGKRSIETVWVQYTVELSQMHLSKEKYRKGWFRLISYIRGTFCTQRAKLTFSLFRSSARQKNDRTHF